MIWDSARRIALEQSADRPEVVFVVAIGANGVIGENGKLPWHLPEDLKHFREITIGHPILMGRKTYESIGRPLPGRLNIVLTRNRDWKADQVVVAHTPEAALRIAVPNRKLMVIGGGEVYDLMLPYASRLEVTHVDLEPDGDTMFRRPKNIYWREVSSRNFLATAESPSFRFASYEVRKRIGRYAYLNKKTLVLMEDFAAGRHIPGSGSAASLMGILAATLILTVVELTRQKGRSKSIIRAMNFIEHQVNFKALPELVGLFEDDAAAFNSVMELRRQRDNASNAAVRKNASDKHLRKMRRASNIPVRTAAICNTLANYSKVLLEVGYKAVRGDSGAALSAAMAGLQASIFVVQTNLTGTKDGAWADGKAKELRALRAELADWEGEMSQRLEQETNSDDGQPDLFLPKSAKDFASVPIRRLDRI